MTEYPKLITDVEEKWKPLFAALYFHERQKEGMPVDPRVPVCPLCK